MAAQVVVPQLGESVVEARVARWLKKEGDAIAVGDPLVELETEKIDLEVNADQAGVLGKILRQEGEDVKVGEHTEIRFDLTKQLQETESVAESEQPSPEVSQTKRQKASLEIFWKNLDDGVHYFSTKPAVIIEYSR